MPKTRTHVNKKITVGIHQPSQIQQKSGQEMAKGEGLNLPG